MFLPPSFSGAVEFRADFSPRAGVSHVIFDFDGTLSWLRHGWPQIMYRIFREHYPVLPGESEEGIHDLLLSELLSLNGQPSIRQMERFAERVRERGVALDPGALLQEYARQLDADIRARTDRLHRGLTAPDEFVVHGARALLDLLAGRGLTLIILSGTVEHRVKEEAELLDLTRYFGRHIYGSTPDPDQFSKRRVMDRLLREEGITGGHLLAFGDGPVEIEQTKALGGLAVAVASDEDRNGSGMMNPHKRRQLTAVGADAVIPDYRDAEILLSTILQNP